MRREGEGLADIFISYARSDRAQIEKLSTALEVEGFSVWWDRRIYAGSEFSRVIEQELDRASAVIVAWSAGAKESSWVKDEAAAGNEQGKLVPIRLDGERPPMGFRQYQALDLSAWDGKVTAPEFQELLGVVKAHVAGEAPSRAPASTPSAAPAPERCLPGAKFWIGGLAMAILSLAVWIGFAQRGADTYEFDIYFNETVAGLSKNSIVQYNGIDIGAVADLVLDPEDPSIVVARLRIRKNAPIKTDSVVALKTVAGRRIVHFSGGSAEAPLLADISDHIVPRIQADFSGD